MMVKVIDALQDLPGHFQILGIGMAFHTLCAGAGVKPTEVLQMIERMERDIDGPYARQFAAMKEYAKHELND
jgi:hypothetical protein